MGKGTSENKEHRPGQVFCSMCGAAGSAHARFCRTCGAPLEGPVAEPRDAAPPTSRRRTVLLAAAIGLLAVGSTAAVILLRPDEPTVTTAGEATDGGSGDRADDESDGEVESERPTDGFHPVGVGPVRIGMTQSEVEAALGTSIRWDPVFDDRGCSYVEFPPTTGLAGVTDPTELYGLSADGFELGYLEIHDYEHVGLEASTVEGVSLGDPESRVAEVYDTVRVETRPYDVEPDHWLIVPLPEGTEYVFGTSGGVIDLIRIGRQPDVSAIEGCA